MAKNNLSDKFRIRRSDPNNIVIEKAVVSKTDVDTWKIIGYYGNSPNSLVSGLLIAVVSNHTPEAVELREQLETLRLELVSSRDELRKVIEAVIWGKS